MINIIFKTFVTFCICYTLIDVIICIFDKVFSGDDISRDKMFVVIKVLAREENLEYIIRSVIWKNLRFSKSGDIPNVLIVDMSKDEQTAITGKCLARDYEFIYYTNHDNIGEFIKTLNDGD